MIGQTNIFWKHGKLYYSVFTISDTAFKLALHHILDYMMITSCVFELVLLVMPCAANNFYMKNCTSLDLFYSRF